MALVANMRKGGSGNSVLLGTYTTTSTVNVLTLDTDVSHYVAVCDTTASGSAGLKWVESDNVSASFTYTPASLTISDGILTIVPAKVYAHSYADNSITQNLSTKVFYVGAYTERT